jgi:hypothetical protein
VVTSFWRFSLTTCINNDSSGKFATNVNSRMPYSTMNSKKEGTPVAAGKSTSEWTPTSAVTQEAKPILTTAGPKQQQKSQ